MRNEKPAPLPAPLPSSADGIAGAAATGIVGAAATGIVGAFGTAATPIGTPETRACKTDFTVREINVFIRSVSG